MQFKGNAWYIAGYNGAAMVLFGLAASVGLMGPNWPFLFIASLAVMMPVGLLISLAQAWANRFSFDDARGALVWPGGRRVPYDRVRRVQIVERGGSIDVFVQMGRFGARPLVESVPPAQAGPLREELAQRFPGAIVARSRWASVAPVLAVIALVLTAVLAAHAYLYSRYPQVKVPVLPLERLDVKQGKVLPPLEYLGSFGFTPPPGFRYIGEENGELYFEDRPKQRRMKAVANITRGIFNEQALLFRRAMGVADYADLMTLAYRARYGIIPLFLRSVDLQGLDRVAIFEAGPPARGFVSQGLRGKVEETHIVIMGERPDQEVHFFFFGPDRLSERTLQRFLTGIQPVQTPGV
jgi:hypothetical protein